MLNLGEKRILLVEGNASIHQDFHLAFEAMADDPLLQVTRKLVYGKKTKSSPEKPTETNFITHFTFRGKEAIEMIKKAALSAQPYDVVFINVYMPYGMDVVETVKEIWQIDTDIQVVIYSANINYVWDNIAHQLQNNDNYMVLKRPFDAVEIRQLALTLSKKREFKSQLKCQLKNIENLESEHHIKIEEITTQFQHQETHDQLTGLPNRILLMDRIQQSMAQAKRYGMHVGILFIDIDHFKQINNDLGHSVGDMVLKEVAKRLNNIIRESDTLARLDGDEFVAVFVCQPREDYFMAIARKFMHQLAKPYTVKGHTLALTVSIGISIYPTHGLDVVTLLKNADSALYKAKEDKNTCLIYRGEFNKHILQKINLTDALAHAVERKELLLYYQPVMELNSEKISCVEALLRWRHPILGLLSPMEFIPIAEESGLIIPIGEWVIRKACLQLRSWIDKGMQPIGMAVNISLQQFKRDDFVEMIETIIHETQMDPNLLELELKENILIGKTNEIIKKINRLRDMGVHLVIDDFGVGCASLSYLRQFPFEKIKIDRNIIQGVNERPEDAAIVKAIIALSKSMKVQVIAEGVETFGQLDFLRSQASDQVQGYIFHKPLDESLCFRLLQKRSMGSFVL